MSKLPASRRQVIASLAVLPAAAAVPAAALANSNPPDRAAWNPAMRAHEAAEAAYAAYEPTWRRIHDAWEASRPNMDTIHWKEFPFGDRDHVARVLDLDAQWQRFLAGEGKLWWGPDPEGIKDRHRAALDSVQAFRDAEEAHSRESGVDAANERIEQLAECACEATWALMRMPAPDLAALRWKLDYLTAEVRAGDGAMPSWTPDALAQTLADISCLLPAGA